MLLLQPSFRKPERMSRPPNLNEAEALGTGVTPVYAAPGDTAVIVETPEGETFSIDAPGLIERLSQGLPDRHTLSLLRSDRSMTDCRPVSLFGICTARRLS